MIKKKRKGVPKYDSGWVFQDIGTPEHRIVDIHLAYTLAAEERVLNRIY